MKKRRNNKKSAPAVATANENSHFFQPKLSVSQPNDIYEQEANSIADKITRSENTSVQPKRLPDAAPEQSKNEIEVHQKNTSTPDSVENYLSSSDNRGQPLPEDIRNFYEPRFGHDFSNVKIHTDSAAAKSAGSINALAYTSGSNIVFNNGQFAPDTVAGKKLLGHELAHVIQQQGTTSTDQTTVQRQEVAQDKDLPGSDPQLPRNTFFTPDSLGISNNNDSKISLDIHIDYLPSHTWLHVFIATEPGGYYQQGQPLKIIGEPGKGWDETITLSPVPSHFYIRFEARSETTGINVPNIRGTCILNLD